MRDSDKGYILNMSKPNSSRGVVEKLTLKKSLSLNSLVITEAVIEIDHINYGLNKSTKRLNKKARSNFTLAQVEHFLMMLQGEYILPRRHRGMISEFEVRVDCPVPGRFFGKEFILIFNLDHRKPDEIHTITIYPGW